MLCSLYYNSVIQVVPEPTVGQAKRADSELMQSDLTNSQKQMSELLEAGELHEHLLFFFNAVYFKFYIVVIWKICVNFTILTWGEKGSLEFKSQALMEMLLDKRIAIKKVKKSEWYKVYLKNDKER